jgi:hypothetical protein
MRTLQRLSIAAFMLATSVFSWAGVLNGRFVLPTTAVALQNATLTLALSQAATVPGSFSVVPLTVTCFTSTDGSVVGLPNPTVSASAYGTGSGSLPSGTYFVRWTYVGAGGESLPSPESVVKISATGSLVVNAPVSPPPTATGWNVYIGSNSGGETRQASLAAFTAYTQSAGLATGSSVPASNSSTCTLQFNDATIPAPTYYVATLTDSAQNLVAGFPQNWYLSGSVVDVSQLVPLSSNPSVRYPEPILSTPASGEPQSVASSLNLNGYALENSSNVGPGIISGFWSGIEPAALATLDEWTPNAAITVRRLSVFLQSAGSGGSAGTTYTVSDGTSTCTFTGMVAGSATTGTNGAPSGVCNFAAGVSLMLQVTADDHTTRPGNVAWKLESTSQ